MLRTNFAVTVVDIERQQRLKPIVMPALPDTRLEVGDLLIAGMPPARMDDAVPAQHRSPTAPAIVLGMLVLMANI